MRQRGLSSRRPRSVRPGVLSRRSGLRKFVAAACALLIASPAAAQQLPSGGSVAAGSAAIVQPNANTLNINQSTNQAIINWNSFSVGQGGTVNFNQPGASSATLNRVLGSTPSSIAGTINAPGTVLLVNPNGIAISKTGVVNVGSFAASTLDIKNEDFLAGRYKFTGNGGSAAVSNAGRINVSDGGFAALMGGQVSNSGVISARLGKVGLGAGELVTLDFAGDGFLSVAVPSSQIGKLVDASGALVTNSGKIRAKGGQVFLSAATASNILRDAVNVPGSIRANSVGTRNGKIVIGGGSGGKVSVTGKLAANGGRKNNGGSIAVSGASVSLAGQVSASGKTGGSITALAGRDLAISGAVAAKGSGGQGGSITVTGADVRVLGALIDASGTSGGTILIGGDYQGGGTLRHADSATVDAATTIRADATVSGDGGKVIVWSDGATSVAGSISARNGAGGAGGLIETSGHYLSIGGARIDAGAGGNWLLDPYDLTANAAAYTSINASLNAGTSVTLLTTATGASGPGVQNASGNGDIILTNEGTIGWTTAAILTMSAYRHVVFETGASITHTGAGGGLVLRADNTGTGTGTVQFAGANQVSFDGGGTVSLFYNPTGDSASVNGVKYTGATQTDFTGNVTLAGGATLATSMLVNTVFDLQNMQNAMGGRYALGRDIDAGATATWNGGLGFNPIGPSANPFTGSLDGGGHTIANLTINRPTQTRVGLIGSYAGGSNSIANIGLVGGSVTGNSNVGWLAGFQDGGSISQAYATGNVSGSSRVGGLVGLQRNSASISQSYTTGDVSGIGSGASGTRIFIGGLVGEQLFFEGIFPFSGSISQSYATGNVSGGGFVGGLIGSNAGSISQSYATGNVSGGGSIGANGSAVGGLVGLHNNGSISQAYATGNVLVTAGSTFSSATGGIGGLVGLQDGGSISQAYATGSVSGTGNATGAGANIGGLVGIQQSGSISQAYATGNVSGTGTASGAGVHIGGLVGHQHTGNSISQSYATGNVSGSSIVGGLVGRQHGTISQAYATGSVTGNTRVGGLVGAQLAALFGIQSSISEAYATGSVTGVSDVGGLVGFRAPAPTIAASFWDTQTTGREFAVGSGSQTGATGLDTAQMQAALPADFNNTVWGIVAGVSYPYLTWRFPTGPTVVSGIASGMTGGNAGLGVGVAINGTQVASTATGANGAYHVMLDPVAPGAAALTWLTTDRFPGGTSSNYSNTVGNLTGSAQGHALNFDLAPDRVLMIAGSNLTTLSGVIGVMEASLGGSSAPLVLQLPNADVIRFLPCDCSVDFAPANPGDLISTAGTSFQLLSSAASLTFQSTTAIGGFSPPSSVQILGSGSLTLNGAIFSEGDVLVTAPTGITLGNGSVIATCACTGDIVLATNGAFINNGDDTVLQAGGRWLIYSDAPGPAAQYGDLDSGSTAIWNASFATLAPGSVIADGNNRYLFNVRPQLTFISTDASKIYGDTVNLSGNFSVTAHPGVNGAFAADDPASAYSGSPLVSSLGAEQMAGVGSYQISLDTSLVTPLLGYSSVVLVNNARQLTVDPRAITVTADAKTKMFNAADPAFTYQITSGNLVNADTLAGALARAAGENAGAYAILQGTLAASPNYALAFVGSTLTIDPPNSDITASQVHAPQNTNFGSKNVNITFQDPAGGPVLVSFTPPGGGTASAGNGGNVVTASIQDGLASATNNGFTYRPFSQFDPNQYSQFTLPDFAGELAQAALFAMIARAADPDNAANYLIDTFWNGTAPAWDTTLSALEGKVTFSDGAGNTVVPSANAGFPIVAGTDIGQLLQTGPVMIGGSGQPPHWLLATQLTADGKGIVANDPVSGQQVVLSYDAATKTVGGVTGVFDAAAKKFVSLADAGAIKTAGGAAGANGLASLQDFTPASFLAVTVK